MPQYARTTLAAIALIVAAAAPSPVTATESPTQVSTLGVVAGATLRMPLAFEPNLGQADPAFRFVSRSSGLHLALGDGELAMNLVKPPPVSATAGAAERRRRLAEAGEGTTMSIRFRGAGNTNALQGEERLAGFSNYLVGTGADGHVTGVPHYRRVRWTDAYPGVDVVFYGHQRQLEYDFVVRPGASPDPIALDVSGADSVALLPDGDLALHTAEGPVVLRRPVAFQQFGNERREVDARYLVDASGGIRLRLGEYDRARELVIDPLLLYSTFLGGTGTDEIYGMATDASGHVYVTGTTTGSFPTKTGSYRTTFRGGSSDAFVTKINPWTSGAAGVVYSTYLGGDRVDLASAIKVDSAGNAYVIGDTDSTNFPTTKTYGVRGGADVFVTKLSSLGSSLSYSVRLGGSGADYGASLGLDATNQVYGTGVTFSTNFPTSTNGYQKTSGGGLDAVLFRLSVTGNTLGTSTYLGGSGDDEGIGIAVDADNNRVVLCGVTTSANFPTRNPYQSSYRGGATDAFMTILRNSGTTLEYSTYFGGSLTVVGGDAREVAMAVALDQTKNIYMTGYTSSTNFPTQRALFAAHGGGVYDAFLAKFNPAADTLIFSTYYGGNNNDAGLALAVDNMNNPIVGGSSFSTNLPYVNPVHDYKAAGDGFVAEFASTGFALNSATYLGGSNGQDIVYALASDIDGFIYAGGMTTSSDFPKMGAAQNSIGGATDGFVSVLEPTVLAERFDSFATADGWSALGYNIPGFAAIDHDAANSAIRAFVAADPNRFRLTGWITDSARQLPYSSVGAANVVRAKFFVYTTGQQNPSLLNTIPNMRLRVANRFAVNSMLEVFNHLNSDPATDPFARELRPSSDPARPSLYRVDHVPVHVPFLADNAGTEGVSRGFEAYSTDPQDNGYVALAESHIGTYPAWVLDEAVGDAREWFTTAGDAGGLRLSLPGASLSIMSLLPGANPGDFPVAETDPATSEPVHSESSVGVTLDTTAVPPNVIGVAIRDFTAGTDRTKFLRVEEGIQYRIRYHLTSTQQSNRNAQVRLRARTVRFSWAQKVEVGGAYAAGVANNTIAQQALPGVGSLNPDKIASEDGGWYTMVFHSPLNGDIRPESGGTLGLRMPNLSTQPGPGVNADSRRDLRLGLDLIDTLSFGPNAALEEGRVTVDRIVVTENYLVDD